MQSTVVSSEIYCENGSINKYRRGYGLYGPQFMQKKFVHVMWESAIRLVTATAACYAFQL